MRGAYRAAVFPTSPGKAGRCAVWRCHFPSAAEAAVFSDDQLHDINLIARFLACDVFAGARPAVGSADLLVLLGNALLPTAWRSFDAVRAGVAPR
ncbi:hypothetical protein ABY58_08315, partial [Edwardsiella ictaluri]